MPESNGTGAGRNTQAEQGRDGSADYGIPDWVEFDPLADRWARAKAAGVEEKPDPHFDPADPERTARLVALDQEFLRHDELHRLGDPVFLVQDALTMETLAWFAGVGGSAKSLGALDLACCVSLGIPWRGHEVLGGPVAYIVAEGARGMRKRKEAWELQHGIEAGGVYFLPRPVQAVARNGRALSVSREWRDLAEVCRRRGYQLIVLDTQARMTLGLEENSSTEMGYFVEAAEHLRQVTGACVLIVHHSTETNPLRGSSAIKYAGETIFWFTLPSGSERRPLHVRVNNWRQKDTEKIPDKDFHLVKLGESAVLLDGPPDWVRRRPVRTEEVPNAPGETVVLLPAAGDDLDALREAFGDREDEGWFTSAEAADVLEVQVRHLSRRLDRLMPEFVEDNGRGTVARRYRLVRPPEDLC